MESLLKKPSKIDWDINGKYMIKLLVGQVNYTKSLRKKNTEILTPDKDWWMSCSKRLPSDQNIMQSE